MRSMLDVTGTREAVPTPDGRFVICQLRFVIARKSPNVHLRSTDLLSGNDK
jgi:hypothetical protein